MLHVKNNLYGQKQSGRVWNQHLHKKLTEDIGFKQSEINECLCYKGRCLYVLYTDDSILCGPDSDELDKVTQELKDAGLDITCESDMGDFLGVKIDKQEDGKLHMSQPHLID